MVAVCAQGVCCTMVKTAYVEIVMCMVYLDGKPLEVNHT